MGGLADDGALAATPAASAGAPFAPARVTATHAAVMPSSARQDCARQNTARENLRIEMPPHPGERDRAAPSRSDDSQKSMGSEPASGIFFNARKYVRLRRSNGPFRRMILICSYCSGIGSLTVGIVGRGLAPAMYSAPAAREVVRALGLCGRRDQPRDLRQPSGPGIGPDQPRCLRMPRCHSGEDVGASPNRLNQASALSSWLSSSWWTCQLTPAAYARGGWPPSSCARWREGPRRRPPGRTARSS